jgi:TPP-dependent pyruvate/acetoin dehydrogenase alpha subunit
VMAVYTAAGEAVRRARSGKGPTLIACTTYRTRAHSEGMRDAGYRAAEEIAQWKDRDPIKALEGRLLAGAATQADLEAVDAEVKALVEEASAFALSSQMPDASTVTRYVYSEG